MQHCLAYKNSQINYYTFGSGDKILFCLHGYGEEGSSFSFLENYLGSAYTLYAIDFPFHGSTSWNEKASFAIDDLILILNTITSSQTKKISVLAYSMGGRAAMHLLQQIPKRINRMALIAPDGLRINFWYWLTTQTDLGNNAFLYTMNKPQLFFSFLNTLGKLRIYNKSVIKFVHYYLDDKEQRQLLYKRWTCMRKVKSDLLSIRKTCIEKDIRLNFLFGKYDRIILSKRADVCLHTKNISIKVIDAGHQLLKEKYVDEIIALLND